MQAIGTPDGWPVETSVFVVYISYSKDTILICCHFAILQQQNQYAVELQWLEHLWYYENMF